jgi:hypothetical protein
MLDAMLTRSQEQLPVPDTGTLRGDLIAFARLIAATWPRRSAPRLPERWPSPKTMPRPPKVASGSGELDMTSRRS